MKHLTSKDYTVQPWANGRGQTVELWRAMRDGALIARLSMARVDEDGPFSCFPGIARNLTVIAGPGFQLRGDGVFLDCLPLTPVAFPGDIAIRSEGTAAGASDDFNVMTANSLPTPQVQVLHGGRVEAGGLLALFSLEGGQVNGTALARHDLILTQDAAELVGGFLVVRLFGL